MSDQSAVTPRASVSPDALRIARYIDLSLELPPDVFDAGNADACAALAPYKMRQLSEALTPFVSEDERRAPADATLVGRLLGRAVRYRYSEADGVCRGGPRAETNPVLTILMMGAGPLFIYRFMTSPSVRRFVAHDTSGDWTRARSWLADPGPAPSMWSYAGFLTGDHDFGGG